MNSNSMKLAIKSILEYLIVNKATLAENKFSGMYSIPKIGYRIHQSHFLPTIITHDIKNYNIIDEVVEESFPDMKWDSYSLWLTI